MGNVGTALHRRSRGTQGPSRGTREMVLACFSAPPTRVNERRRTAARAVPRRRVARGGSARSRGERRAEGKGSGRSSSSPRRERGSDTDDGTWRRHERARWPSEIINYQSSRARLFLTRVRARARAQPMVPSFAVSPFDNGEESAIRPLQLPRPFCSRCAN